MSTKYAPRPAVAAFNASTMDRAQRLTEETVRMFTDTAPGSSTESSAMAHAATPAYARIGASA